MSRAYMIRILRGGQVVHQFEAMASDSISCVQQHIDLCDEGEKLDVMGIAEWRELQREHRELMLQVDANRRDPLLREVY